MLRDGAIQDREGAFERHSWLGSETTAATARPLLAQQ